MILTIYTVIHTVISLVGVLSGFALLYGLITSKPCACWTTTFFASQILTDLTGFAFPFHGFKPSYVVGIISLVLLLVAMYGLYGRHLAGAWRKVYVVTAVIALYLDVFVAIIQSFLKIPALDTMAPTQTEAPFKITQLVVLVLFIVLGTAATIRFHDEAAAHP
jgi:uncharacterized membrane protein